MPWSEITPMDQKKQFMMDFIRRNLTITELSQLYNVSRKTSHKWINRYMRKGAGGLVELSRAPRNAPHATPKKIVDLILETRRRHPYWGPKKLLRLIRNRKLGFTLPHRSTVSDILRRNGMVPAQRRRRHIGHPGKPSPEIYAPNDIWNADFKGHFKTKNGIYCYPLTVTDSFSRYLLCCQGLGSTAVVEAKPMFTRLFKEFGLPKYIRSDNGVPFATYTLARLSRLSAWWIRLGIMPMLIEPGCPQQNGSHERMHRTLKAETTRPVAGSLAAQQRKFNAFRDEFNNVRPHEALDMETPASCYQSSPREMPNKLPALEYPDRFEVRLVSDNGGIRWNCGWINVSTVCNGEYVGLEEIDNGLWNVYFGPLKLGRLNEKTMRIEDQFGTLNRKNV